MLVPVPIFSVDPITTATLPLRQSRNSVEQQLPERAVGQDVLPEQRVRWDNPLISAVAAPTRDWWS